MKENESLPATQQSNSLKSLLSAESTKKRFSEILGKKAPGFISSIISAVNGSTELQKCSPETIIGAAAIAASLDLPIVPGLGFAGLVPYWNGKKQCTECQFQIMKKGYVQLAQRSGTVKTVNVGPVYDGQLISENPFTGEYEFDANAKKSEKVIGFVAYLKLINGFEKYKYMTIEQIEKHARKYSQAFKKGFGLWGDREQGGFEAMGEKTVLKLLLSGYAPLNSEIQMAIRSDSSVIENGEPNYIDNPAGITIDQTNNDKERQRIINAIEQCAIPEDLDYLLETIPNIADYDLTAEIEAKKVSFADKKKGSVK